MKKNKYLLFLFVILVACAFSGCRLGEGDLSKVFPLVGKHAENLSQATESFTPEQEYYLGRAVAAQIIQRYPVLKDDRANRYLNQVGQALALCSPQPYTFAGYHFQLLDTAEVNAFAAPSGLIFITKGMVGLLSGESELAAVLAHEIAHVQNGDAVKSIKASRMTEAFLLLGKDTAGQYGSKLPGEQLLEVFSGSIDDMVNTLVSSGYSRSQEYGADAGAKEILTLAGYNPQALDSVLRTMEKRVPSGSSGLGSTHPSASDRLSAMKQTNFSPVQEPGARSSRFNTALGKYKSTR